MVMPETVDGDKLIEWTEDGYPTPESLERLRQALNDDDIKTAARAFYAALRENRYPNYCGPDRVDVRGEVTAVWAYHTGGWSGNEDIIEVLQNSVLWWMFLERYDRGGHYYFRLPPEWIND